MTHLKIQLQLATLLAWGFIFVLQVSHVYAQEPTDNPSYSFGFLPLQEDELGTIRLVQSSSIGTLPTAFDLAEFFPKPGDQGPQGSCVGWAVSYLKSYFEHRKRGWALNEPAHTFSPAYIYNQVKSNNNCEVGSAFPDALNLVKRDGAAPLAEFPYQAEVCEQLPTEQLKQAARTYAIAKWGRVDSQNILELKSFLVSGYPILIGMMVDQNFMNLSTGQIWQYSGQDDQGSHAMVVMGYDDSKQAFHVINSWGTDWGEGGYGWISYESLRQAVQDAYVVEDLPVSEPLVPISKQSMITIEQVKLEQPMTVNQQSGVVIHLKFTTEQFKDVKLAIAAYFAFASGKPLKDSNDKYTTHGGQVATQEYFTPSSDHTTADDFTLFIPYEELHLAVGKHQLKVQLQIYHDKNKTALGQPSDQSFEVDWSNKTTTTAAPTAKIETVLVKHNSFENGRKGMGIYLKFSIDNLKDQEGQARAYFFLDSGEPLKDRNNRYTTYDGQVAVDGQFTPAYTSTRYEDFKLFMPYSELHLIGSNNNLKFQVQLYDTANNSTLASTDVYTFQVNQSTPTVNAKVEILNGDFEAGHNDAWAVYSNNGIIYSNRDLFLRTPLAHSGNWSAVFGVTSNAVDDLSQQLTLPNSGSIYLHYWYQIASEELTTCDNDIATILINSTVVQTHALCFRNMTGGRWKKDSVDLTAYAGQTVALHIRAQTNDSKASIFLLDDVSFGDDNQHLADADNQMVSQFLAEAIAAEIAAYKSSDINLVGSYFAGNQMKQFEAIMTDLSQKGLKLEAVFDYQKSYIADIRHHPNNQVEVDSCEFWTNNYFNQQGGLIEPATQKLVPQTITIEEIDAKWFITDVTIYKPDEQNFCQN